MITSKQNSLIKLIRGLDDKANRLNSGLFVVEGIKGVSEAISTNQKIKVILLTEKNQTLFRDLNIEKEIVSDEVFKSISSEVSPQGALAVIYKPDLSEYKPNGSCLFLDGVSDPSNIGAIIRTAAATDIKDIFIADGADAYNPKSVRASMGGIFRVRIFAGKKEELLSKISLPIIVADMKGENIFSNTVKGDFCLVIGNESRGVSQELKNKADKFVSIPMQNGMESLNAAVSAGILMYLLSR
ncbi:MAG: RNA methyltransferase [Clostridia bacterium]|nr:RNA methyltransferase [Clostridia bacterium]